MPKSTFEALEPRLLFTAVPLITEFLASNDTRLGDEDGDSSDWIELYNAGDTALDLAGWHLTDDASDLTQWAFPAVSIDPGQYLVVFASSKDRADADGTELHTSFKLGAGGEYLALVEADGSTVAFAYAPQYPAQATDVSYGLAMDTSVTTLIAEGAMARYRVPTGPISDWNTAGYNDLGWAQGTTGIGYESSPENFSGLIETPVPNGTRTVYLRQTFNIADPLAFDTLSLGLRYDDGFVAYLNGVRVAERFAPVSPAWNSYAVNVQGHPDSEAVELEAFDLTEHRGALVAGNNVLAIQVMNANAGSSDLLIEPMLTAGISAVDSGTEAFMTIPTPGAANVLTGPLIISVTQDPPQPSATQDLVIEAAVSANAGIGLDRVDLHARIGFGSESVIQMFDDGLGSDVAALDGVYTADIDSTLYTTGDMVRWYVTAEDIQGTVSRAPMFADQSGNNQSPAYFGTVVADPAISASIPVFQWFTQNEAASHTRAGTRASVFYDGRFYDNIYVRQRGGFINLVDSQKFDFNKGDKFYVNEQLGSVGEINLNGIGHDTSYVRQPLAFELSQSAGNPGSISFLTGMWVNGSFDRVGIFIEQVDSDYLKRNGLNPEGSLYKVTGSPVPGLGHGGSGVEEKEDTPDLAEIVALSSQLQAIRSLAPGASGRVEYLFENFNIPEVVNYLAVRVITGHTDDQLKNFYLHRDTGDTGEWSLLPWDYDGSMGNVNYHLLPPPGQSSAAYPHPFFATSDHPTTSATSSQWNLIYDVLLDTPVIKEMMLRRLRTLMDMFMQHPDTLVIDRFLDARIDALYGEAQNLLPPGTANAIDTLKNLIQGRRTDLYLGHTVGGTYTGSYNAGIPNAQPIVPTLTIADLDYKPVSGENDEEYIQLTNNNAFAIDLSGWTVEDAITHTFKPGTVIAAGQSLYITAKSSAFRARATGPTGGQGLFVQQWDSGQLSAQGETITIKRADGTTAATLTYEGDGLIGDLNADGYVGAPDLQQLLIYWGDAATSSAGALAADLNSDGTVNTPDLNIVLANFGQGTAPTTPTSNDDGNDTSAGGGTDAAAASEPTTPQATGEPQTPVADGPADAPVVPATRPKPETQIPTLTPAPEASPSTRPKPAPLIAQRAAAASRPATNALTLARPGKPIDTASDTVSEPRATANPPRRFNALAMSSPR